MKIAISRRYIEKACRQGNIDRLRDISTASMSSRIWSGSLSFTSPKSDFVSSPEQKNSSTYSRGDGHTWSSSLPFASPESAFVSASKMDHMRGYTTESKQNTWSKALSFASPESDFSSAPKSVHSSTIVDNDKWSGSLSFASPESDFVSAPRSVHTSSSVSESSTDAVFENLFQSHYLYPSAETATGFVAYMEMVDEATIDILLKNHSLKETLPKTMKEALNDERPIVITTAESPFRVVDVNGAWEGLCGYSREEAIGCNIGSLLQGPDTNMESANAMIRSLQENGVSERVLTNYAKNGKSFENHLQIGVIPVGDGDTSSSNDVFFVGVLNNISQSSNESVAAM